MMNFKGFYKYYSFFFKYLFEIQKKLNNISSNPKVILAFRLFYKSKKPVHKIEYSENSR